MINLEICHMEKLEFKGKNNLKNFGKRKKEKRSEINEIGQIFYEILRVKIEKNEKKLKKSKEDIEVGLSNMKIKERKAIKYLKLLLCFKKNEGKIKENEINICRKIVKGLNKK